MKAVVRIMVVLAAVWLQASFFGAFNIGGILPNLLLVVIIYAGLICAVSDAVIMALLGGLLLDLASGPDFGLRMGFYVLLALLIAVLKQAGTDFENTGMVMAATLAATVLFDLTVLAGLLVKSGSIPWVTTGRIVTSEILINCLLALLLRWPLGWLLGKADFSYSSRKRVRSI